MMDTATHKSRIGIYGGTFDPFHMGHLHALRAFDAAIHPDAIWLVPTYLPPHKTHRPTDDPAQRLAMLRALCASDTLSGLPCRVEPYEIEKAGKSYTYDTLRHFARADRILYFLLGTDMFCTLPQWHRGAELFALAHMVCIRRGGAEEEQEKQRIAAAHRNTAHSTTRKLPYYQLHRLRSALHRFGKKHNAVNLYKVWFRR